MRFQRQHFKHCVKFLFMLALKNMEDIFNICYNWYYILNIYWNFTFFLLTYTTLTK